MIIAKKLTNLDLARSACSATLGGGKSNVTLDSLYKCEHSPARTQIFWIEMHGISSFVSVHLVRHKIGVEHFVQSMRDDTRGKGDENRYTPVLHSMLINAQSLINLSRKRLCNNAHRETVAVMQAVKLAVGGEDPALAKYMVPECVYRGGICHEIKPCGEMPRVGR